MQRIDHETTPSAATFSRHYQALFEQVPGTYVVLMPDDYRIVAATNAYLEVSGKTRQELIGKTLFDAFPDDPAAPSAEAVTWLRASLARVRAEGRPDALPPHRFPLRQPDGSFSPRWWSVVSAPVFDHQGRVIYIIHRPEDVTEYLEEVQGLRARPLSRSEVRLHNMAAEAVKRAASIQRANDRLRETERQLREEIDRSRQLEAAQQRLLEQVVSAQEDERGRVARELHDSLGQHLTALRMRIDAQLRQAPERTDPHALEHLRQIVVGIDREVDRLATELRPLELDELGLEGALREHVRRWALDSGVQADIQLAGLPSRLPPALETTLFRVVQEALTNVRKHASATRVSVVVGRHAGQVFAVVEDDGCGFNPAAPTSRLGVTTMRERATLLGGTVSIESSAQRGTAVYLRIPYAY